MGAIKTALSQIKPVLPQTEEFESLTKAALAVEDYAEGLVAAQKQLLTDMNDRMMTTYADSMAMYDQMLTRIQEQFASVNKKAPLTNVSETSSK